MTWTHRNIEIEPTPSGQFIATIGGTEIVKPSLLAIKKAIDAYCDSYFREFTALRIRSGDYTTDKIKVTGIARTRKRRWGSDNWITSNGGHESAVAVDSPENIAAIKAYKKSRTEHKRIAERLEKELQVLEDQIITLNPPAK